MDNNAVGAEKTYKFEGRKRFGTLWRAIPTVVTVKDEAVHVRIEYKKNQIENYNFQKKNVSNVMVASKFLFYTLDLFQILVALLLMFISPLFIFVIPVVIFVYLWFFVRFRHVIITLKSGEKVYFPVTPFYTGAGEEEGLIEELMRK